MLKLSPNIIHARMAVKTGSKSKQIVINPAEKCLRLWVSPFASVQSRVTRVELDFQWACGGAVVPRLHKKS